MFNIYTAIDILDGSCVRLHKGDYAASTVYDQDPLSVARSWKNLGAKFLHIVDLDGAKSGYPVNASIIQNIVSELDTELQVGGGIRKLETIEALIDCGVTRVIIGSAAVKDPALLVQALARFGSSRVVLGVDCQGEYVAIHGWQEKSQIKASDLVNEFKSKGLRLVHYTDISRDGTLAGPNIDGLKRFVEATSISTINSGGVSCIEDIWAIKNLQAEGYDIDGVIVGKALYENRIKPEDLYNPNIYS